ncbi:MAG: hypothetical protein PHI98_16845, partial [Eubacteriales bacterium]|nr:hypothetical protein [Eubacteriales bacterium]
FEYLKALENLPLYLYTGGSQERALRASFPNARSYPDNALLPRTLLSSGMTEEQWMKRNKAFLMERTARQHPDFTHIAWVDMDILNYPICPQILPDFSEMMDDRIHLATIDGLPDASFLMTPIHCLSMLCREVASITQLDAEMGRDLSEETLLQRIFSQHPDLFALHPMPRRRLLFYEGFDPQVLDEKKKALLKERKPVYRAEPMIQRRMERTRPYDAEL